ncbi:antibiotic biosynthesis monooxygenase [Nocardia otitidiscaviarum]|uniref:putative quinol monooxygenase n=1 Tax=Nocardia otitidiscaviarum TaxID=1823 RepID=UPI001894A983|nr:putative quinol monooxygenase [Nocardia otitidiscaviarum]MBF6134491.1 antibiotic biosynthesis monooxygenase [Nocardia otitidiscaviarum]
MTLHVTAEFRARTGREDRLRTALEGMIEPSLAESGCLVYRPFVDPNDAAHMVLVEEWTGAAALAEHFETPHFHHVRGVLDDVLAEPMVIRRLVAE